MKFCNVAYSLGEEGRGKPNLAYILRTTERYYRRERLQKFSFSLSRSFECYQTKHTRSKPVARPDQPMSFQYSQNAIQSVARASAVYYSIATRIHFSSVLSTMKVSNFLSAVVQNTEGGRETSLLLLLAYWNPSAIAKLALSFECALGVIGMRDDPHAHSSRMRSILSPCAPSGTTTRAPSFVFPL